LIVGGELTVRRSMSLHYEELKQNIRNKMRYVHTHREIKNNNNSLKN